MDGKIVNYGRNGYDGSIMPQEHYLTPDAEYWTAFARMEKIGAQKLKKINSYFPSMRIAWESGTTNEFFSAGLDQSIAEYIVKERNRINPEQELAILLRESISIITVNDGTYPSLLKEIPDHPAILFCRGNLDLFQSRFALGVVGTRKMSQYGKDAVSSIVSELAKAGVTIVSGMALGVDGHAHQVTLDVGGKTIAVLAGGIDDNSLYPKMHYHLGKKIIEQGLVISEFPPGTEPRDYFFPFRNRIIAGFSRGVLIIEAPEKSGTLLTANYALEYNRDVFAVPNSIFSPNAAAPNSLIKKGATPVERASDVFRVWELDEQTLGTISSQSQPETTEEILMCKLLATEPLHIDELTRQSNLDTGKVSVTLTLMEMKGMVKRMDGGYYRKS